MIAALRSEMLKLTSVRLWWILLLILVVYVAFTAALVAGIFGAISDQTATPGAPALPADLLPPIVYSSVTAVGYAFPLILGALAVTSEFRYQTVTPTFLAQPRRGVVLGAKAVVLAVAGALYGVAGLVASIGLGAPILGAFGIETGLGDQETWLLAARAVLAMALWATIGVGLGTLIPNQVASIVVVLAFTQFVEPILRFGTSFIDWTAEVGKFLPGAASDALVGASVFTSLGGTSTGTEPLEWWQGGLVLAAYAVVIAVAGSLTTWRKDVS
ncbi:ABC-2 type transport system permease protein [Microbacteriaceae bacterium SG_E_30_P1]|uniref:ABC-2 type transport system permease protein n=1 Tax=Antiquaquibacter oligotrophicus TaxID=2880260 RepID=A0ABT6KLC0_9MICO|nr:ABC transporter permease [Antiquaquibacter oligotrophicus]MDH6180520.1 ABC-2 type transport system permease protein [Antiquaquibacter oligotrophicus]UDF13746.1 ABC transporter permease [Antiquaquibacter oligotrophicus]